MQCETFAHKLEIGYAVPSTASCIHRLETDPVIVVEQRICQSN